MAKAPHNGAAAPTRLPAVHAGGLLVSAAR